MPKTYRELNPKTERCVYDALENVPSLRGQGEAMGAYVNSLGLDADDDKALVELAKKYGFNRIEIIRGADFANGVYRFDNNAHILASITNHYSALALFDGWGFADNATGTSKHSPTDIFGDRSLRSAEWHVIYGRTDANYNVVWVDKQNRYRNGPITGSVAVCFIKK